MVRSSEVQEEVSLQNKNELGKPRKKITHGERDLAEEAQRCFLETRRTAGGLEETLRACVTVKEQESKERVQVNGLRLLAPRSPHQGLGPALRIGT